MAAHDLDLAEDLDEDVEGRVLIGTGMARRRRIIAVLRGIREQGQLSRGAVRAGEEPIDVLGGLGADALRSTRQGECRDAELVGIDLDDGGAVELVPDQDDDDGNDCLADRRARRSTHRRSAADPVPDLR